VALADRYHELLELRIEGLRKYGARLTSEIYAPPAFITMPTIGLRPPDMPFVKIGPMYFGDHPPVLRLVEGWVRRQSRNAPLSVLEFGPGKGTLAGYLLKRYGHSIRGYYGIDRDPHVTGPYRKISGPDAAPTSIDLVIASEVIEHMPLDAFYDDVIVPAREKLTPDGAIIVGIPNALSPGAIFRDFSHMQAYPWYDLYAILRLAFSRVKIYRTHYVWSGKRLAWLLPRMLLVKPLEQDWCDGLISIASEPLGKYRS